MNNQLYIYDCLAEKLRVSDGSFMTIGGDSNNTFVVEMSIDTAGSFAHRDGICRFFPHSKLNEYSLNGARLTADTIIPYENMCLFVVSGGCFLGWYGDPDRRPDFSQLNPRLWYIYNNATGEWRGPSKLNELAGLAHEVPVDTLATFQGLDHAAFVLGDIIEVATFYSKNSLTLSSKSGKNAHADGAQFLCPTCWERFQPGEALAIATHPDLIGDKLLGEDVQARFIPKVFDSHHIAYDVMGSPCNEYACPKCHYKLPPFFQNTHQHIFSLVGVPASGKTYYLSSLIHQLELELPRDFGLAFRDADPSNNAALNDMRMRLFSAQTPQEAYLGKTRLEGDLYQKVWRHGHFANMPRPFIYNLNKDGDEHSIVVYDNAGENFQPNRPLEENHGAEHLSVASAILYLFDPTTNPGFRNLLKDNTDPQLRRQLHPAGRQALLLAETEMRLRTRLNMPPGKKLKVPFALIIGKCDTWQHLLGPEPLLPVVRNGKFMPEHVKANSARLRQFLFNISPYICTNAEAISSNVCYFAASSLGSSPVEFTDEKTGATLIAPASGKVHPIRVIDPALWALHCVEPNLFPCTKK